MKARSILLALLILCSILSGCLKWRNEDIIVDQPWSAGTEDPAVIGGIIGYENYEWYITQSRGTWASVMWIHDWHGGCEGYNETVEFREYHRSAVRKLSDPYVQYDDSTRFKKSNLDELSHYFDEIPPEMFGFCLVISPGYNDSMGTIRIVGWNLIEVDWSFWGPCCLVFLVMIPITKSI